MLLLVINKKKEEKENARIQDELLGKIIETSEFSLNDDIVAEIEDELLEEFEDDIHAHGMSMEQFFQRDILIRNQISYAEALEEVVNILVDGIVKR